MSKTDRIAIPHIYPELYTHKLGKNLVVYNPMSNHGVYVLNTGAQTVYRKINGKRNLFQIYEILQKKEHNLTYNDISKVVNQLKHCAVVYTELKVPRVICKTSSTVNTWLHITNQCNLRCKYCFVSKTSHKMSLETGMKSINAIFVSAVKHKFKEVFIRFSGGESLLEYKKILLLIAYSNKLAKSYNLKVHYVVLTNGTLLTEEKVKKLKIEQVHVFLSMDGIGKVHDLTRHYLSGQGSYSEAKRGLDLLIKHKISFNISIVVTKYNILQLPKFVSWLIKNNIPITFSFFRENCNTPYHKDLNDSDIIIGMKKIYKEIDKNLPKFSLINSILDSIKFGRSRLQGCGIGTSYIAIRQDGSVSDCQMTMQKSVGNINDDVIESIRNNSQIRPKGLTSEQKQGCKSCQWRYTCAGGCALATYQTYGRYDVPSPYCAVYKALIPEVINLEAKRILKYYSHIY
jgi:uncharacterized protein